MLSCQKAAADDFSPASFCESPLGLHRLPCGTDLPIRQQCLTFAIPSAFLQKRSEVSAGVAEVPERKRGSNKQSACYKCGSR